MTINVVFSKQELLKIKQKLRYIDFLAKQNFAFSGIDENLFATTHSALMLSGRVYLDGSIYRWLTDDSVVMPEADFVRRYATVVSTILNSHDLTCDEARIIALGRQLNGISQTGNMQSVASTAIEVSEAMSDCVEWLLVELSKARLHPMVTIAIFLYEFVSQPTLSDDREEMMHLLALLLMRRCGADWVRYYAPCRIMAMQRVAYHNALKVRDNNRVRERWVLYWLDAVCDAGRALIEQTTRQLPIVSASHKPIINQRQYHIVKFIEENQPVKLSDIVTHLHKESVNTIKKDLLRLRELGYITTEGVLKGTVYYKQ